MRELIQQDQGPWMLRAEAQRGLQVELRQNIWRRIGCVVWGGAGNVFPSFEKFKWGYTLPNYGIGLRWEFKKRINIRVDYGFGKHTSGFLFNINEAF